MSQVPPCQSCLTPEEISMLSPKKGGKGSFTVPQLKEVARKLCIPLSARITKPELLNLIQTKLGITCPGSPIPATPQRYYQPTQVQLLPATPSHYYQPVTPIKYVEAPSPLREPEFGYNPHQVYALHPVYAHQPLYTHYPVYTSELPGSPIKGQQPVYIPQAPPVPRVELPQPPLQPVYISQAPSQPVNNPQAPSQPVYIPQTIPQPPSQPVYTPQPIPQPPSQPVYTPQPIPQPPSQPVYTPQPIPQPPSQPVYTPQPIPQPPSQPVYTPQPIPQPVNNPQPPSHPVYTPQPIPQPPLQPVNNPRPILQPIPQSPTRQVYNQSQVTNAPPPLPHLPEQLKVPISSNRFVPPVANLNRVGGVISPERKPTVIRQPSVSEEQEEDEIKELEARQASVTSDLQRALLARRRGLALGTQNVLPPLEAVNVRPPSPGVKNAMRNRGEKIGLFGTSSPPPTFQLPRIPTTPSSTLPQAPAFLPPQAPVFQQPQPSSNQIPQAPIFQQPQPSSNQIPQAPIFQQPQPSSNQIPKAPVFQQPQPSSNQIPQAPIFQQPQPSSNQIPQAPVFQPSPTQIPQAPVFQPSPTQIPQAPISQPTQIPQAPTPVNLQFNPQNAEHPIVAKDMKAVEISCNPYSPNLESTQLINLIIYSWYAKIVEAIPNDQPLLIKALVISPTQIGGANIHEVISSPKILPFLDQDELKKTVISIEAILNRANTKPELQPPTDSQRELTKIRMFNLAKYYAVRAEVAMTLYTPTNFETSDALIEGAGFIVSQLQSGYLFLQSLFNPVISGGIELDSLDLHDIKGTLDGTCVRLYKVLTEVSKLSQYSTVPIDKVDLGFLAIVLAYMNQPINVEWLESRLRDWEVELSRTKFVLPPENDVASFLEKHYQNLTPTLASRVMPQPYIPPTSINQQPQLMNQQPQPQPQLINQQPQPINQQPQPINQQPQPINQQPQLMNQRPQPLNQPINQQPQLINQQPQLINQQPQPINQRPQIMNQQSKVTPVAFNLCSGQQSEITSYIIIRWQVEAMKASISSKLWPELIPKIYNPALFTTQDAYFLALKESLDLYIATQLIPPETRSFSVQDLASTMQSKAQVLPFSAYKLTTISQVHDIFGAAYHALALWALYTLASSLSSNTQVDPKAFEAQCAKITTEANSLYNVIYNRKEISTYIDYFVLIRLILNRSLSYNDKLFQHLIDWTPGSTFATLFSPIAVSELPISLPLCRPPHGDILVEYIFTRWQLDTLPTLPPQIRSFVFKIAYNSAIFLSERDKYTTLIYQTLQVLETTTSNGLTLFDLQIEEFAPLYEQLIKYGLQLATVVENILKVTSFSNVNEVYQVDGKAIHALCLMSFYLNLYVSVYMAKEGLGKMLSSGVYYQLERYQNNYSELCEKLKSKVLKDLSNFIRIFKSPKYEVDLYPTDYYMVLAYANKTTTEDVIKDNIIAWSNDTSNFASPLLDAF